jgi:DNA-binding NarL/FixJ family response regulator
VGEASDALEAIEVLASARPDAVILDFKMPGGNALSVLKYIRQEEMSVVVIVLTNYPYQQYRRACLSAGAHYFFDKSCEFEKVIRLLEQLISES